VHKREFQFVKRIYVCTSKTKVVGSRMFRN
jgi:hypothetical protein